MRNGIALNKIHLQQRNDLDDDNVDATATTDVTIAVDNDAATVSVEGDEGSRLW